MKTEVTGTGVLALTAVAGLGLLIWLNRDAIKGAVQAVNPASDQNVAYRAVTAATQAATGDPRTSFGSWLYDLTHPNQIDPTAPTVARKQTGWDEIMLRRARETAGGALNDAGWVEALGADGRRELVPPTTPGTWLLVAGISAAIYAGQRKRRRRSGRGR